MKYLFIIEPTSTGYSAYSPDLEGCITTGATLETVKNNMQEAIEFHLAGLRVEGYDIPQPRCLSSYVEIG